MLMAGFQKVIFMERLQKFYNTRYLFLVNGAVSITYLKNKTYLLGGLSLWHAIVKK